MATCDVAECDVWAARASVPTRLRRKARPHSRANYMHPNPRKTAVAQRSEVLSGSRRTTALQSLLALTPRAKTRSDIRSSTLPATWCTLLCRSHHVVMDP